MGFKIDERQCIEIFISEITFVNTRYILIQIEISHPNNCVDTVYINPNRNITYYK